jgi:hypothetical protein
MKTIVWLAFTGGSAVLCLLAYLLQIENLHYGFSNPGVASNTALVIVLFSAAAILMSIIAIAVRHKKKTNYVIPCIVIISAIARICQTFITFAKYR